MLDKEFIRTSLKEEINSFIESYRIQNDLSKIWKNPLIGFADARSEQMYELRTIVSPNHFLPEEMLDNASIVISYFLPFENWVGETNLSGQMASKEWSNCYKITNELFLVLNQHLKSFLLKQDIHSISPEEYGFVGQISPKEIYSNWSQRHIAYLSGLGTMGVNNMLITDNGTCGRLYSLVTDLQIVPDCPQKEEYCLYKRSKQCGLCVKQCPVGALSSEYIFDRKKCSHQIALNVDDNGQDVCGKCVVGLPCTYHRPTE